jgi:hypothetical protein
MSSAGVLTNSGSSADILVDPGGFNPRDATQWTWIVGDEAPEEDTISQEKGVSFMSGYLLDHNRLYDALAWFVGYSHLQSDTKCHRWNPAVHPPWSFLRCSDCSIKGVRFNGEERGLANVGVHRKLKNPVYERYRFDLSFINWDMEFWDDKDVADEWSRCITTQVEDLGEIVTLDGGQYRYRAPSNPALNNTPVVLNGPQLKVYTDRVGIHVRSWGLPAQFVLNQYGLPTNFMAAKGRVNSHTLLGKPPQTLLLLHYDIKKIAQPIKTRNDGALAFNVAIDMHFGFQDPPRAEESETLMRGWNLVPAVAGTGLGGWFGIENVQTGEALYPSYDMRRLLQRRDD